MKDPKYCSCYYSEESQQIFSINLLTFGYEYFMSATHIKYIDELENFIENKNFRNPDFFFKNVGKYAFDNLIDAIRLCICFENYMKAKLLLNNIVIHKVSDSLDYLSLRNEQKKRPILLSEIKSIKSWKKIEDEDVYILPGLTEQTLNFSTLMKDNYQSIIKLPSEIKLSVLKINEKRNSLHFLTGESGTYSKERIAELKNLIQFVNFDLAMLQNEMIDAINESPIKKINVRKF